VWQAGGSWEFPFGTDDVGRCILSRIIYGARLSLIIGTIVVTLSLALGIGFGRSRASPAAVPTIAIHGGSWDIVLAMPSLLLAIVIVAILGRAWSTR